MTAGNLSFTLWDVGHGVSIWIRTPNGSNHWIDLGRTSDFSPSRHVRRAYGVTAIDYLTISHPDKDHLEDLPEFKATFGDPKALMRNKSLPPMEMFGQGSFQYQRDYADLHNRFTHSTPYDSSPTNPERNGGVRYAVESLDHGTRVNGSSIEGNNTSVVVMLLYEGVLFACPGDIEPLGWQELWRRYESRYSPLIGEAYCRFLVAPHHGRRSGYCKEMMDAVQPHATIISDVWGVSETHRAFRSDPIGVTRSGETRKYYTTKRAGRVQVVVSSSGFRVEQHDR
jgi:competence protein ComEC